MTMSKLTKAQMATLREIAAGANFFEGKSARSVEALRNRGMIEAKYSYALDKYGRSYVVWDVIAITEAGLAQSGGRDA